MTGPVKAAAGLVGTPSYTFNGASGTGFYLAGANQIGWSANGVQGATFNSDTSVTWVGGATFGGTISANKGTIPIGFVGDLAGSTVPSGWLLCFGQLVSTTTYAGLFAVLSTTYGSGAGTFGIPDYRGRTTFGQDNMGGSAANRITATVNFDGTVLGNSGGGQSSVLITGNLPAYTPSGTVASSGIIAGSSGGAGGITNQFAYGSGSSSSLSFTASGSLSGVAQGGTSIAFTNLPPAIISNKIIFAGV